MQLVRFSFDLQRGIPIKVLTNVDYPLLLTLPQQLLSDELQQQEQASLMSSCSSSSSSSNGEEVDGVQGLRYALAAVVMHNGKRATAGHYYVYCRNPDPAEYNLQQAAPSAKGSSSRWEHDWRCFNDAKVSSITVQQALSAQDTVSTAYTVCALIIV